MAPGIDGSQAAPEVSVQPVRLDRQEPVRKEPPRSEPAKPIIRLKPTVSVPPMAPPPVPAPKKQVETKKRAPSAVDEVLGAELDAIEGHIPVEPKRLKILKPVLQAQPTVLPSAPVKHDLPKMTLGLDLPFKQKRAKALVVLLKQDPNSPIVSKDTLAALTRQFHRPVDPVADGCPT